MLLLVSFATVVVLAGLIAWLAPHPTEAETTLASDGPAPNGALGLFETLARLGWHPVRRETPIDDASPHAVYVAVRRDHGVDERTAGQVLAAVRNGAGLVVDVRPGDPLSDSLRLTVREDPSVSPVLDSASVGDPGARGRGCRENVATDVGAGTHYVMYSLADTGAIGPANRGRVVLLDGAAQGRRVPVVAGIPYGRGRIVAVADASVLTNAAIRACWAPSGVAAVRAFEWASAGAAPDARPRVVFFEGLHDPSLAPQPSVLRAIRRALTEVPPGRMVTQLIAAALVLLAAAGVRALPPVPTPRVARRSPLEHVGALARAYREVRASRVAARRLASGLRRRYGATAAPVGGNASTDADVRFLDGVAARHPARAADAARLAAALGTAVPPAEVVVIGEAAARLAETLDAARRGRSASV